MSECCAPHYDIYAQEDTFPVSNHYMNLQETLAYEYVMRSSGTFSLKDYLLLVDVLTICCLKAI